MTKTCYKDQEFTETWNFIDKHALQMLFLRAYHVSKETELETRDFGCSQFCDMTPLWAFQSLLFLTYKIKKMDQWEEGTWVPGEAGREGSEGIDWPEFVMN